ncbi:unnamed protein product [Larinioides sclopetarius]|uniref:MATH domain-containing protein n=1 Tax=Larinioides sclopetarius TaxID=280406 RepID=A0AAV2AXR8_9ARAC
MAEGGVEDLDVTISNNEQILDGHQGFYLFEVHRLDATLRNFKPLEYKTECESIATTWDIELKYDRIVSVTDTFTFSIKMKRKGPTLNRVKASIKVSFNDVDGNNIFGPIFLNRERMLPDDALEYTLYDIQPLLVRLVATVEIHITIQYCHQGICWKCASEVDKDKNRTTLSKL